MAQKAAQPFFVVRFRMVIPQLKSTAVMVALILVGVPMATCFHMYLSGELHGWEQLPDALNHASFTALMAACGWILFRSPFAGKITELLNTTTTPQGGTSTTSIKVSEPAPEPPKAA